MQQKKKRGLAGFTLVETAVVLVVLAILASLLVPAMIRWIEKAQAQACRDQRLQLIRYYQYEQTLYYDSGDPVLLSDVLAGKYTETEKDVKALKCPAGGAYTADDAAGTIQCSIASHNDGGVAAGGSMNLVTNGVLDILEEKCGNHTAIDSNSQNGTLIEQVKAALLEKNIDLDALGVKSWTYLNNGAKDILLWTTVDIKDMSVGTVVPVLRYNTALETYSVWNGVVRSRTQNGETYNVLTESSEYSESKALPAEQKTDYDQALVWFQNAMAASGLS